MAMNSIHHAKSMQSDIIYRVSYIISISINHMTFLQDTFSTKTRAGKSGHEYITYVSCFHVYHMRTKSVFENLWKIWKKSETAASFPDRERALRANWAIIRLARADQGWGLGGGARRGWMGVLASPPSDKL